jgi:peptidoglycan-N-acetylglucosamine deacetylase
MDVSDWKHRMYYFRLVFNKLNELKRKKYKIISFREALLDEAYNQEDKYYKKWGISWIYRWMNDQGEISLFSKREPKDELYDVYKKLLQEQKNK